MVGSLDVAKPDMAQNANEVKNPINNESVPIEAPRIEPSKKENVPSTNHQTEGSEMKSKSDSNVPIDMPSSYLMPSAETKDIHPEIISQGKQSPNTTGETIHEPLPAPSSAMESKPDTNVPIDMTSSYTMPSADTKDVHPEIQTKEKESSGTTEETVHKPLSAPGPAMEPKPDSNVPIDMTSSYPMPSADTKDIHPEIQTQEKESSDTTRETIHEPLPAPGHAMEPKPDEPLPAPGPAMEPKPDEPLPAPGPAMEPKPDTNVPIGMTSSYTMPSADTKDIHPEIQSQENKSPDTITETIHEPSPDPQAPI